MRCSNNDGEAFGNNDTGCVQVCDVLRSFDACRRLVML